MVDDIKKVWIDIEIGEQIQVGDRCYGRDGWFFMEPQHIEFESVVDEATFPIQREVKI